MAFLLIAAIGKATITIESIDINTTVPYTLNDIQIDANISTDENRHVVIKLFDNNTERQSFEKDLNSADGNLEYYNQQFITQFTEGTHTLDINIFDTNNNPITGKQKTITVLANPIIVDENISWALIQQYILPIARSLSECLVEKTDLNVMLTQNNATLKALQNDVAISLADKQAAEDLLAGKQREAESCQSARATCEADKTTTESKLSTAQNNCETEKASLKTDEENECDELLDLKETTIIQRDNRILELKEANIDTEIIGVAGWIAFFALAGIFAYLYFKERIR